MKEIEIIKATIEHIPDLVRLQRMMFEALGYDDLELLNKGDKAAISWYKEALVNEKHHAWVARTNNGKIVSSGALVIYERPPGPLSLSAKVAFVMNVVTIPNYRRKGIAHRIMREILEWLSKTDVKLVELVASEWGKPLYESMNFININGMRLKL